MLRLVVALGLVVLAVLGGLGLHAVRDGHQFVGAAAAGGPADVSSSRARRLGEAGGGRGTLPRPVDPGRPGRCRGLALLNSAARWTAAPGRASTASPPSR